MKEAVEGGSQANEKVEEEEVRVLLDEEGILVKTGGQENDTLCAPKSYSSNSIYWIYVKDMNIHALDKPSITVSPLCVSRFLPLKDESNKEFY